MLFLGLDLGLGYLYCCTDMMTVPQPAGRTATCCPYYIHCFALRIKDCEKCQSEDVSITHKTAHSGDVQRPPGQPTSVCALVHVPTWVVEVQETCSVRAVWVVSTVMAAASLKALVRRGSVVVFCCDCS